MKNCILSLLFAITLISLPLQAHEGHGTPGSIPPAPHGGKVKEAIAEGGHKTADQTELFFEVVLSGRNIKIYPLTLDSKNLASFTGVPATTDLSGIDVTIESPRAKKEQKIVSTLQADSIEGKLPEGLSGRFIVRVTATQKGSRKTAKIQFEGN